MNIYFCIILGALVFEFFLFSLSKHLDLQNIATSLPNEFKGYYSASEYTRSQEYLVENTRFSYLTSAVDVLIILMVILFGLFNNVDLWLRDLAFSPMVTGRLFFGILFIFQDIIKVGFPASLSMVVMAVGQGVFNKI